MSEDDDCVFKGLLLRISNSAMFHLRDFDIDAYTLCDMIQDHIECPKKKRTGKPFRKTSNRICSNHKGRVYNIILDKVEINGIEYWSVSHLEPI